MGPVSRAGRVPRGRGEIGGEGQKFDPEAPRPRCLRGFRDWSPGRAEASSVHSWDTPRRPRLRTHEWPAEMFQWQDGGSSRNRAQKMPLGRDGLGPTLEMGHQVNSTFGVGRSRVAFFVARRDAVQSRQPASRAGRAHAGREAKLGDAGGSEAPSSAQKLPADNLSPLLRKASALNYLQVAGKFILIGRGVYA